jgi:adenosylcobinamide-phosphate synthase
MATLAAALGVRLEKPGVYTLDFGAPPTVEAATRSIRLVTRAGGLALVVAGVVAWF